MATIDQRYDFLDGMRGIAAICVMATHYFSRNDAIFMPSAFVAVDFFFLLSGFVLAHSYGSGAGLTFGGFLKKRVIRLYPMFFLGVLIALPWLFISFHRAGLGLDSTLLAALLGIFYLPYFGTLPAGLAAQMSGTAFPVNQTSWSLFFEMVINAAFLLLDRLKLRHLLLVSGVSLVMIFLMGIRLARLHGQTGILVPAGGETFNFLGGFPRVTFSFVLGMAIYRALKLEVFSRPNPRLMKCVGGGFGLSLLLVLMFFTPLPKGFGALIYLVQIGLLSPLFVAIGAKVVLRGGVFDAVLKYLGFLSYPIYCIHIPIQSEIFLLSQYINFSTDFVPYISVIVTLFVSIILGQYCDIPLRRWLTQTKLKPIPPSAAVKRSPSGQELREQNGASDGVIVSRGSSLPAPRR